VEDTKIVELISNLLDQKLQPVNERLEKMDKGFNERLEKMDKKFQPVNERLEKMDKKFQPVNERLEKMDKKFQPINDRLGNIESGITSLQHSVDRIERYQEDNIMGILRHVNKKIDEKENAITLLNSRLFKVEAKTLEEQ
jgi:predicted  nucleic acid-binding Zn-ribbon protein